MQNNNNDNDDQSEVASTTDTTSTGVLTKLSVDTISSTGRPSSPPSTADPTNQKVDGPCYAHATARVMLHAWRHLRPDLELPPLEVLIAVIIAQFAAIDKSGGKNSQGKNTKGYFRNPSQVIVLFCDPTNKPSFRRLLPSANELGNVKFENKNGKQETVTEQHMKDYFKLPKLNSVYDQNLTGMTNLQLIGKYKQDYSTEIIFRFGLTVPRWAKYDKFFNENSTGILTAKHLELGDGEEEDVTAVNGHVVVIDLKNSSNEYLTIKDSRREMIVNQTNEVAGGEAGGGAAAGGGDNKN